MPVKVVKMIEKIQRDFFCDRGDQIGTNLLIGTLFGVIRNTGDWVLDRLLAGRIRFSPSDYGDYQ